jgi:hypothetical protein
MFERESGDLDPEFDGIPRSAAEEGTDFPVEGYPASGSIPLTGDPELPTDPGAPQAQDGQAQDGQEGVAGNRPASDAVQTESASQAGAQWRASDAATDFLGLDDEVFVTESLEAEFTPVTEGLDDQNFSEFDEEGQLVETSDPLEPPPGMDRESWLMGLDDADAERVGTEPFDPENELPEQIDASYSEPDTKGRVGAWVVRGAAVAAVLAATITLVKLFSTSEEPIVEPTAPIQPTRQPVANNTELSRPESDGGTTSPEGTGTTGAEPGAAVHRDGLVNEGSKPPAFDPALQGETTAEAIERAIRDSQGNESVSADAAGDVPVDAAGKRPTPEQLDPTGKALGVRDPFDEVALDAPGSATSTNGASDSSSPVVLSGEIMSAQQAAEDAGPKGGLRYANDAELAAIWDGTTIPLDSVSNTMRVMTPNVGRVRAVMASGQVFEGRMYAVGEGKVWIDNRLGRMALVHSQLTKVEHVLSPEGAPGLGDPGSGEYVGLPRVRAKAAGGVFFGKLIHQDADRVTLITEEGARLTLIGAIVDPAPSTRRVIVKGYDAAHAIDPQ